MSTLSDHQLGAIYRNFQQGNPLPEGDPDAWLDALAFIVDEAGDRQDEAVLQAAIAAMERVDALGLSSEQKVLAYYFAANANANIQYLRSTASSDPWTWDCDFTGRRIFFLRKAVQEPGFDQVVIGRRAQVLTNLGSALSEIGRPIEGREYWDRALEIAPGFGMALGNRGIGSHAYARFLGDSLAACAFLQAARQDLDAALTSDTLEEHARENMEWYWQAIARYLGSHTHESDPLSGARLGETEEEEGYRLWCLRQGLFLDPLNDLGPLPEAASDSLHLPSMRVIEGEGPHYWGFYNQLKQEYASARYFYYEGVTQRASHFADRGVALVNTLDYPAYGIGLERVKAAYRLCYSIFDKVGFFLNAYLQLGIAPEKVSFRKIWYDRCEPKRGLNAKLRASKNWPLQGLYWLSKDLYAKDEDLKLVLEPEARELDAIRNHVEHKYLKLHREHAASARREGDLFFDGLSFSMNREEFEVKGLKLMKLARAALIYLAFVVTAAEHTHEEASPKAAGGFVLPLVLDIYEDNWKT